MKDIDIFMSGMHETVSSQLNTAVAVVQFYQDNNSEAKEYHHVQQLICRKFLVEFVSFVTCCSIDTVAWGLHVPLSLCLQEGQM